MSITWTFYTLKAPSRASVGASQCGMMPAPRPATRTTPHSERSGSLELLSLCLTRKARKEEDCEVSWPPGCQELFFLMFICCTVDLRETKFQSFVCAEHVAELKNKGTLILIN